MIEFYVLVTVVFKLNDVTDGAINSSAFKTIEECVTAGEKHQNHWSQAPYEQSIFYSYRCTKWKVEK